MNTDNMIFGCVQIEKIREKVYNRKQRYASCVFLKWFTQKEQNLEFVVNLRIFRSSKKPIL